MKKTSPGSKTSLPFSFLRSGSGTRRAFRTNSKCSALIVSSAWKTVSAIFQGLRRFPSAFIVIFIGASSVLDVNYEALSRSETLSQQAQTRLSASLQNRSEGLLRRRLVEMRSHDQRAMIVFGPQGGVGVCV